MNANILYIINGGNTTKYFELQKGARQGDPISAYLFISCLEIVFLLIKANKRVKGINIFKHTYLYSAYADDTTFFSQVTKDLLKDFLIHLLHFESIQGRNQIIKMQNFRYWNAEK